MRYTVSLLVFFSFIFFGSQIKAATYTTTTFGKWNDSARWINGLVPPSTIAKGDTVLINHNTWISSGISITNNGAIKVNVELFRIDAGGNITNNGEINALEITNNGSITNNGTITISEDLFNRSGALINNTSLGSIELNDAWITNASLVVTQAGVFCDGNGTINNDGNICVVQGTTGGLKTVCDGGNFNGNAVAQGCQMASVHEFNNTCSVELFPNPANDYLNLRFPLEFDAYTMEILDATGRLRETYLLNNNESRISTKNLNEGLFFYHLFESKGRFHYQGRFIIEH